MTKDELIEKAGLKHAVVAGMGYHSSLPPELEQFYCYVKDAGHCILVLLPDAKEPYEKHIIPASVKTVLKRGYSVKDGYVWCDIPYVPFEGLVTEAGDGEFDTTRTGGNIVIVNDGALIKSTNYWLTVFARAGKCYFSVNAGCIRLLLSGNETPPLGDDVLDGASYVIVTRGKYRGHNGYEVLFEDKSSRPFVIITLANQWDRLLPRSESGRMGIPFHVYRNGHLVRKMTARFRMVPMLPYLHSWKQ